MHGYYNRDPMVLVFHYYYCYVNNLKFVTMKRKYGMFLEFLSRECGFTVKFADIIALINEDSVGPILPHCLDSLVIIYYCPVRSVTL